MSTAATSTGSVPGSGISASRVRSAPISTAASRPISGWPTTAALPPAAVTAATTPSSSDRAPDGTATVPARQLNRQWPTLHFERRQQTFAAGNHSSSAMLHRMTAAHLPDTAAIFATKVF